jgi:hypothetical protein
MGFLVPFIFIAGILGLAWAYYNYKKLSEVSIHSDSEGEEKLLGSHDHFDPVTIGAII